jgi:hypothetical protein
MTTVNSGVTQVMLLRFGLSLNPLCQGTSGDRGGRHPACDGLTGTVSGTVPA